MRAAFLSLAFLFAPLVACAQTGEPSPKSFSRMADAVRATEAELKFTQIPWETDLFEGFRLAKEERRPVFLYMITGNPLDDC